MISLLSQIEKKKLVAKNELIKIKMKKWNLNENVDFFMN